MSTIPVQRANRFGSPWHTASAKGLVLALVALLAFWSGTASACHNAEAAAPVAEAVQQFKVAIAIGNIGLPAGEHHCESCVPALSMSSGAPASDKSLLLACFGGASGLAAGPRAELAPVVMARAQTPHAAAGPGQSPLYLVTSRLRL